MAAVHDGLAGGTARWRAPFGRTALAVTLLTQLVLPLLVGAQSVCIEGSSQVLFGTGNMAFSAAMLSSDGG